ncbi:MAG: DUF4115 domain-containing protein [Candidatus Omnitrophica bacterium]|nr:DUF4115 domain-containing protein [Candidatus Omnitrophota bacterium]
MELVEICNKLGQVRKEKNISLQEISKKTRLHPSILRNIEEAKDLDEIGKFYLKGFLKIYAQFLKEGSLLKEIDQVFAIEKPKKNIFGFRQEKTPGKEESEIKEAKKEEVKTKPQVKPKTPKLKLQPPKLPSKDTLKKIKPNINKKTLAVIASVAVLLILLQIIPKKDAKKSAPDLKAPVETKTTKTKPVAPTKSENEKPLVSILTKKDVFVEVSVDGKLIFQNVIIGGTKESWIAQRKLEIKISNPSLVSLEIGNQIIPTSNTKRPALYIITPEGFRVEK